LRAQGIGQRAWGIGEDGSGGAGAQLIADKSSKLKAILAESSKGRSLSHRAKKRQNIMNSLIIVDPKICSGKPAIKGTRIMVKNILGMLAGGYAMDQILNAYPELTPEMVKAALEYAAAVIDEEQVIARA
jgi:uncharacterized protein (DUF433 family)